MSWPKVILLALVNYSLEKFTDTFIWCPWAFFPRKNLGLVVPGGSSNCGLTFTFKISSRTSPLWPTILFRTKVGGKSDALVSARPCTVSLAASWILQMPHNGLEFFTRVWTTQSSSPMLSLKSLRAQPHSDWLTSPMMSTPGACTLSWFAFASFQSAWALLTKSSNQDTSFTS
jgi:hypothetical protein